MSSHASGLTPTEHGAYGLLLFPLASALALEASLASVLLTAAFVVGFLSHRALLVALRLRPASETLRGRAFRWVAVHGVIGAALAAWGLAVAAPPCRWAMILPAAGVALLVLLVALRADRTTSGEVAACVVLTSCSLPVGLAGNPNAHRLVAVWLVWALGLSVATIAVRSVIVARHATERARHAVLALVLGGASIAVVAVLSARGLARPAAVLSLVPLLAFAVALLVRPPHPKRLRAIGWSLATTCVLTLVAVVGLVR